MDLLFKFKTGLVLDSEFYFTLEKIITKPLFLIFGHMAFNKNDSNFFTLQLLKTVYG